MITEVQKILCDGLLTKRHDLQDSCPGKSEDANGNDRDDDCTARNKGQSDEDCTDTVNPPKDD